ncbi:hypothetical protein ROHU_032598 [Labeo rohita]|uniref:Uncharacterized protein n=1 Tax=Labeo rohita TaxID=84645 RepID=A0A498LGD1_LABRO|nr:hypothetical protein ROHU_032598 [Labeo rohita]
MVNLSPFGRQRVERDPSARQKRRATEEAQPFKYADESKLHIWVHTTKPFQISPRAIVIKDPLSPKRLENPQILPAQGRSPEETSINAESVAV